MEMESFRFYYERRYVCDTLYYIKIFKWHTKYLQTFKYFFYIVLFVTLYIIHN